MAVNIFFSYARKDIGFLNKLKQHLTPLQREGLVSTLWYDHEISAGTEWEKEIDLNLNTAQIILLLVSPDFIASDYCYSIEVKRALERHEHGEACVIPVILRPIYWQGTPFGKLQALPTDAKPVTDPSWSTQDRAYLNITTGIRRTIQELTLQHIVTESASTDNTPIPPEPEAEKAVPQIEQSEQPVSVNAFSNLSLQPVITSESLQLVEANPSNLSPQQTIELPERLKSYRNWLVRLEATLDLGGSSELTEGFAKKLDRLLVEILSTIRTIPSDIPYSTLSEYFESKDNVLENIRQAHIQVLMAIESLPPYFVRSILNQHKPETFYQCLSTCREYLEKALDNW